MANVGYINKEVAKMYGIPYSELTPEQKKILHEDSVRRAKLIKEREEAVLKNNLKAFEDEAKMEKVLASIYASCQKEILASITETIAKVQKAGGEWSYANQSALTRSRGLFEQIGEQIKALGQKEQITFRQGLSNIYRGAENYEKWREAEAKKQEEVKPVEKVNTKTVEKELKENPTPVPEQIKLTDYPQAFYATKPEAKNTQALLDYMNSKTSTDPNVVALYTKMDKLCDGLSDEVVLKVTHGEHRVKRSWNKNFDYVVDVGIPKINPNYIGTYDTNLHEEMHFLDMLITVKDNKDKLPSNMFSQSYKPLVEAFDKATPVIGDKAKKLFEDFAKECDIIYKEKQEAFDIQHEKLKEQYRSGAIDWKKYNSLFKKLQKEVNEEADNKRRALFGGGVSGLQDIYDAVSKGTFRDTGQVTYGHGSAYYTDRRRTNPNCSESLANYASLCVGHPELIDILAEDYPEIVTALRGCVEAMLKEVPK